MYVSLEWLSQLYSLLFNSAPDISQIKYNVYTFLSLFNFLGLGHGVNLNYWLCIPFEENALFCWLCNQYRIGTSTNIGISSEKS